ncbi:cytochrome c [Rhodoferax sp.]|uniref:cytochrome c n=1 Tax=Rhodoferax sp. TaxID=50421 RepID=UPI002766A0DF|nr:cytochrome c [Rhodoferax sp.]
MTYQHTLKTTIAAGLVGTLLASVSSISWANDAAATPPLAMRKIMQDLGLHMQTITDGISRGDWTLVANVAPLVADHPAPPLGEKMRIMGFVGTNMTKFKAHDGETHEQAQAVGKAAKAKDGPGVILAFQKLQTSCYNCHSEFRKPFVAHFYGRPDAVQ